ncbi:hypothetical protein [Mobilicoccus pelagius]|uniref:hypothetical protein n=1 Tax=Mobilicoccus pelagius TaxID=746032 RepID=UPI0003143BE6|nr:hypothetical protein [Mobilicoccus pelagius]
MTEEEQGSGGVAADAAHAATLLEEVVRAVDAGEITATSSERAYLAGSAAALRAMARRSP